MTTYPTSILTAANGAQEITMTKTAAAATSEECCAVANGGADPAVLVLDASAAAAAITVTLKAGDGPAAAGDRQFKAVQKKITAIPFDTAAHVRADGKVYFSLTGASTLSETGAAVGMILHRNVTAN